MTKSSTNNMVTSVRRRLLNHTRKVGEDYNLLLTRYGVERLLYRISRSEHAERFVLKGAMLFMVWTGRMYRPTRDLDLLGYGDASAERLVEVFRSLCVLEVEDDGLVYDPDSVQCTAIRDEQAYEGQRVKLLALLGKARIALQVDIGFGDVVTPDAKSIIYPTLLDHPAPVIRACPPETVVAEKLEAMVSLGIGNSRMKDFYDVWILLRDLKLDDDMLAQAIRATFNRRDTALPSSLPVALSDEFATDLTKQQQWRAFVARSDLSVDESLSDALAVIRQRLWPLMQ